MPLTAWPRTIAQAAELDVLESLASPSSVEKEKAQLAMMKAALQESLGQVSTAHSRWRRGCTLIGLTFSESEPAPVAVT